MADSKRQMLAPHVKDAIERFAEQPRMQGIFRKIGPTLGDALGELDRYPMHFSMGFRESFHPKDYAPKGRPDLLFTAQAAEVAELSGYVLLGNVYKLRALIEDIIDGLNRHRFMVVTGAARALMENIAFVEHLAHKDIGRIDAVLDLSARDIGRALKVSMRNPRMIATTAEELAAQTLVKASARLLIRAQEHLRIQMQLRRSNVFHGGGKVSANVSQTNILTMIKNRLRYQHTSITPLTSYEALCEFVHPNGSSNYLFVDKIDPRGALRRRLHLSATPTDWTLHITVLSLIADPIIECLPVVLRTLNEARRRWASLEKFEVDIRQYSR